MPHALIIIDQQIGIDNKQLGLRNNPDAQNKMLHLLALFRANKWPIFHVKHRSTDPLSVFWPKQPGFEFKSEFQPRIKEENTGEPGLDQQRNQEYVIEKSVPCAFTKNILEQKLQQLGVDSIVVVGASTNNSIESTVRSASNLGFNVTVVEQACFAFDKVDYSGKLRKAEVVHNMSLANLNNEYAAVISFDVLVSQFAI